MSDRRIASLLTALAAAFVLAGPAAAQQDLARVENLGDRLVFRPLVEFAQMILTVTGPCDYQYRQAVAEGDLDFHLDETTIDGVYRVNLVRIEEVDPEVVGILQAARGDDDEETPKALCRAGRLPGPPASQSFGVVVRDGRIQWDPEAVEKSARGGDSDVPAQGMAVATKDQVINDDLIVQRSLCVGFDCLVDESFGFDTIRLKEDNLRIKFDDTSTLAGYSANDWQLTANDSAIGGLSRFSIEDVTNALAPFTIEARAPGNAVYVDDAGRLGNRTSTPVLDIHVATDNTPALRLEQTAAAGFAPQAWDIGGNEVNFFIRDVAGGSHLPLRILSGTSTSSLVIAANGRVGIDTSTPKAPLHVLEGGTAHTPTLSTTALMLQNNATTSDGVTLMLTGGAKSANQIAFGDAIDDDEGLIVYRPSKDDLRVFTGGGLRATFDSTGLDVVGTVTSDGPTCGTGCDRVFQPDFALETIEDHAASMWQNSYLPGVGPTPENGARINLTEKTGGILNELEKAHIFIEQLNSTVKSQSRSLAAQQQMLEAQEDVIRSLEARLAALESTP